MWPATTTWKQYYARDHATYPERIILGSENSHSLEAWRAVAANDYVAGQFPVDGNRLPGRIAQVPASRQHRRVAGLLRLPKAAGVPARGVVERPADGLCGRPGRRFGQAGHGRTLELERGRAQDHSSGGLHQLRFRGVASQRPLAGRETGGGPAQSRVALGGSQPSGVVRVVGKRGGKEAARYELATAGAPQRVELAVDKLTLQANGSDLANIEIRVVDADGRRVFGADSTIEVQVSGAGELAAVDSGDPTDVTPVQASHRKAWQGRVLAIVRAGAAAGKIAVRASAAGLKAAEATVTVK